MTALGDMISDTTVRRMLEEEDRAIMGEPTAGGERMRDSEGLTLSERLFRAVAPRAKASRKRRNAGPPKREARCPACSGKGTVLAYDRKAMVAERRARGLTQTALAKLAGWTVSMVSMLESGSRTMSPKSAERYWKALQAAGKGGAP